MAVAIERKGFLPRFRFKDAEDKSLPKTSKPSSTPNVLSAEEKILIRGIPVGSNLFNLPIYISRAGESVGPVPEPLVGALVTTAITYVLSRFIEHDIKQGRIEEANRASEQEGQQ